ncbi:Protein MAIN-LIKE 1 [Glycine max]|uniref:protein MAIN-LIKE 1-like n=1 Tax=Glycine soja TaxID=3848 RepID=UPI00023C6C38|nr:protein MAIN-LIKE 1-like [Glycine soja]KAH1241622.1 Protein MAIN-LIKE 1 [Glycine max]|eukprot:XP_014632910.1 protein MAIN-LIKE 1-like [Glycine max]
MVRTRGLGRALGQVTRRGVGRGDHDDSDDAPQRRRPTASTRRQRVAVTADHVDEPVIPDPDVQDDPMEAPAAMEDIPVDIPADAGAEVAEDQPQGFPGGPSDPSVLTAYADHVACSERPELKLSSHGRKVHSLGRPVLAIEGLIASTGLSPLIACSVDTGDRGLLSAFVDRWHRETSSFHLPMGELTITVDDISSLLHLPIIGDFHAFELLHVDDAVQMLVDLLMVSPESARAETIQCRGPYVRLQWVCDVYQCRCQAGHWTAAARAYLLHLLGCTLFANKSATNVHVVYLEALQDLSMTDRYAWGVAALVHMYDQLNDASLSHSRQLGGYITLLQCWIYEHFPSVAESTADQDYDEASPRACRWIATKKTVKSIRTPLYKERLDRLRIPDVCWIPYGEHRERGSCGSLVTRRPVKSIRTPLYKERLDRLRIPDVCWIPYGEHREVRDFHVRSCYSGLLCWGPVAVYYRPERVVRQFGYTQTIPAPPVDSWVSYDDIYDRWMHYEDHIVPAGEVCVVPGACSSDYIDWFFRISHPFMTPGHAVDPLPHGHAPQPQVVPQAPQTDIPRVPELGASSTSTEEPRHVVEVCDDIVERLERHLSLGVVTPGSSTHEVIEECLRLARSVTQDHLVYVRCRHRRRTDQA